MTYDEDETMEPEDVKTYRDKKRYLAQNKKEKYGECVDSEWLIKELEKAWAALEFYAEGTNYVATFLVFEGQIADRTSELIKGDQGKRAREALDE